MLWNWIVLHWGERWLDLHVAEIMLVVTVWSWIWSGQCSIEGHGCWKPIASLVIKPLLRAMRGGSSEGLGHWLNVTVSEKTALGITLTFWLSGRCCYTRRTWKERQQARLDRGGVLIWPLSMLTQEFHFGFFYKLFLPCRGPFLSILTLY